MELARRSVAAYGKLFFKKTGLVSWAWYPDLSNYRRDGYDFDARYAVTGNVPGEDITQGAYSRKAEEFKARIIRHPGLLCHEVFTDELERLIR